MRKNTQGLLSSSLKRLKKSLLVSALLALASVFITGGNLANAAEISAFTTDGCSRYPDGIPILDSRRWFHCCFTHDIAYWSGGSADLRLEADQELGQCVAAVSSGAQGVAMTAGVRIDGYPYSYSALKFPWRWGYGFDSPVPYSNLSIWNKKKIFVQFDTILDVIEEEKAGLGKWQIGYMLGRYELLRHELAQQIELPYDEEISTMDERLEIIKSLYGLSN